MRARRYIYIRAWVRMRVYRDEDEKKKEKTFFFFSSSDTATTATEGR